MSMSVYMSLSMLWVYECGYDMGVGMIWVWV